jgi:hypothetical protein
MALLRGTWIIRYLMLLAGLGAATLYFGVLSSRASDAGSNECRRPLTASRGCNKSSNGYREVRAINGSPPHKVLVEQPKPSSVCVKAGLTAIPVRSRVYLVSKSESSAPMVRIDWSAGELPGTCDKAYVRRIAVQIQIHTSSYSGPIFVNPRHTALHWQTFEIGNQSIRRGRIFLEGAVFRQRIGCIRHVLARLRYRVVNLVGDVRAQRVERLRPSVNRCRSRGQ